MAGWKQEVSMAILWAADVSFLIEVTGSHTHTK